jgi:hypothetical protein
MPAFAGKSGILCVLSVIERDLATPKTAHPGAGREPWLSFATD